MFDPVRIWGAYRVEVGPEESDLGGDLSRVGSSAPDLAAGACRLIHGLSTNRACSFFSISKGVTHLTPNPIQASGTFILRVEAEAIS